MTGKYHNLQLKECVRPGEGLRMAESKSEGRVVSKAFHDNDQVCYMVRFFGIPQLRCRTRLCSFKLVFRNVDANLLLKRRKRTQCKQQPQAFHSHHHHSVSQASTPPSESLRSASHSPHGASHSWPARTIWAKIDNGMAQTLVFVSATRFLLWTWYFSCQVQHESDSRRHERGPFSVKLKPEPSGVMRWCLYRQHG